MPKLYDPEKYVSKRTYTRALRAVNALRSKAKLQPITKLPPGERVNKCNCPIQRALKPAGVTEVYYDEIKFEVSIRSPFGTSVEIMGCDVIKGSFRPTKAIGEFVSEFDDNTPSE